MNHETSWRCVKRMRVRLLDVPGSIGVLLTGLGALEAAALKTGVVRFSRHLEP